VRDVLYRERRLAGSAPAISQRVASAAVLVPLALVSIVMGGWALAALAALLAALMSHELAGQFRPRGAAGLTALYAGAIGVAITLTALGLAGVGLVVLALGGAIAGLLVWRDPAGRHALLAGLALAYVGAAGVALIWLRGQAPGAEWRLLWLFTLVWVADTSAYLFGSRFGRHLLVKRISPDKTIEGLLAAIVVGAVIGVGFWPKLVSFGPLSAACASAGLAVVGEIGDLLESGVKRLFGIKDMSNLVPGHGGVLDRLDSLLLVLIVAAAASWIGSI
jgi:phosphatidate cytidylyltransferase